MTNKQTNIKKLIWQILFSMLILIVLGNLIMLIVLRGGKLTGQMILNGSLSSVLIGGSFMIGLMLIIDKLDRVLPWLRAPLKRLIVQFIITVVFSLTLIAAAILLSGYLWQQKITSDYFLETGPFMIKIAFSFVFLGSLISNAIMFFKNWKEAAVQQEKLKREQLALQYETLKSQVNPHFLFNNLNSLTSLISTNPEKAIDFVKKLSEVYRYVLDQKDHELVALETELKFLESFVFLQKIRFDTNLDVQIDVQARNFKVIPLSVQMLVENAIKHNEISDKNPLSIRIFSTDDDYLIVENRLQKKAGSEGSGSGIQNIKDRYEFFTDKKVIISENTEKFLVSIPLLTE
ncbi:MAG: histidine kinase [Bacteroidia bacterium]|nr:histidine kinase [Bacteroidia bacterium]